MTAWFGPEEWQAIRLSLIVASWATLVSLPLGLGLGYVLARLHFPGKALLSAFLHLPLVLPPVVTGYGLLLLLGPQAPAGAALQAAGLGFAFHWRGAALAAAVMGFPLMVRAIRLSLEAVDPGLEQAACTLGASRLWVFLTVTLPLALPGVLAGCVLSFAKAMGEFGATITFVSSIPGLTQTLPTAIFAFLQVPGGEASALRLVLVSVVVSILAVLLSEALSRRLAAQRSA